MIYSYMLGRCGDQLFQYGFARLLSEINHDDKIVLNFYTVKAGKYNIGEGFDDQLKNFNVLPYSVEWCHRKMVEDQGTIMQKQLYAFFRLLIKIDIRLNKLKYVQLKNFILNKYGIFNEEIAPCRPCKVKTKRIITKGYFENIVFFDSIRHILIKEYTPKYPRAEKNKDLYNIIDNQESVCVSLRNWTKWTVEDRVVCNQEYYEEAIKLMLQLHPNAVFIVFSDDIDWVKNNFSFPCPVYYEDGTDEVWEKLRLMYSCKHFIITNSSFAWWAQYLGRYDNKTVIGPSRWYNDSSLCEIIMDSWIKI